MAGNYDALKQTIDSNIKQNGQQQITGPVLNSVLNQIVSSIGENATFAGIATPSTNPGTPDQNVFYLATEPGTYANFGGVKVGANLSVIYNSSGTWNASELTISLDGNLSILNINNYLNSYTRRDFRNGVYQAGSGIVESEYNVVSGPLAIKTGQIITIISGGNVVGMRIFDSDVLTSATTLKNVPDVGNPSYKYTSEYDGYLVVSARDADGGRISPDTCKVSFGIGTYDIAKVSSIAKNTEDIAKNTEDIAMLQTGMGLKEYTGDDFRNGVYQAGSGIVDSEYTVVSGPYSINSGQKIIIEPNGDVVGMRIFNSDDLSTATTLKNVPNVGSITYEYTSEYDGYLVVSARDAESNRISPDTCNVTYSIGQDLQSAIAKNTAAIAENTAAIAKNTEDIAELKGTTSGEGSLSINPRVSLNTKIINDCQDPSTYIVDNGSVDSENKIMWDSSIHVTNGYARFTKNVVDMKNNHLVIMVKINSLGSGANLIVRVGNNSSPSTNYTYEVMRENVNTVYGQWQEFTVPYKAFQFSSGDAEVDFEHIDNIIVSASNGDFNLQYIAVRPNPLKKGIVTFTFDDGWATQKDGIKALAERGVSGTVFIVKDASGPEYLSLDDMKELVNVYGADIEAHGGSSFDDIEDGALTTLFQETQDFLVENGLSRGRFMAYPNGFHSARVVQLAKSFFDACRTIQYYIPIESYPPYDNYRIRAISSIQDSQVETIKQYIDRACDNGTWLILVFHKIEEGSGGMFCSLNALEQMIDYAVSKSVVMNFAEVFESSVVI